MREVPPWSRTDRSRGTGRERASDPVPTVRGDDASPLPRRQVIVALVGSTLAGCTTERSTEDRPEPRVIGHRGCAAENPENTVPAVEAASEDADAVEVDVRRCAGGEPIVFHDETLDRLTDRSGRVADADCDGLARTEVLESGETVPTLREVFDAVPTDTPVVLDLKETGLAREVLATVEEYRHDVLVSSFLPAVLEEVRSIDRGVPTAYIVRESRRNRHLRRFVPGIPGPPYWPENVGGMLETAVGLGCTAIHPRYELCLGTDLVDRAHDAGLRVEAWTVTTREEVDALTAAGVDSVISDVCREL